MTTDCGGPDRCIDDLCRGQDYGICGRMSAELMCIDLGIHTADCERYHEDDLYPYVDADEKTMVDLGGGMVVPLRELMEDDDG